MGRESLLKRLVRVQDCLVAPVSLESFHVDLLSANVWSHEALSRVGCFVGPARCSLWGAGAAANADSSYCSESGGPDSASCSATGYVRRRSFHRRADICAGSWSWFFGEFKCREAVWLRRAGTPRNAWRPADQGSDGLSRSFQQVHAPASDSAGVVRSGRQYPLLAAGR